ncbi:hypothetical protein E2542_SST13191 [Spatholobus suberectus]|nr:hypothetical protein E2542_SST13191 [Spatholobus suberectus]
MRNQTVYVAFRIVRDMPHLRMLASIHILWAIWFARNQWVFERHKLSFIQILGKEESFQGPTILTQTRDQRVAEEQIRWRPLEGFWTKLNFDASVKAEGTVHGLITRDHEGLPLAAAINFMQVGLSPKEAEASCFRWALTVAKHLCLQHIEAETDCYQLLIHWKHKKLEDRSYFHGVVEDCLALSSAFQSFTLKFTKRLGTKVAHELACLAFNFHEKILD